MSTEGWSKKLVQWTSPLSIKVLKLDIADVILEYCGLSLDDHLSVIFLFTFSWKKQLRSALGSQQDSTSRSNASTASRKKIKPNDASENFTTSTNCLSILIWERMR